MYRNITKILFVFLLIISLAGCGGSSDKTANTSSAKKQPVGLYMFEYYCDENGEYVPEYNEEPDYSGYPRTEIERFYDDKKTFWVKLDEDGKGEYHTIL